jgi:hypothetical protein
MSNNYPWYANRASDQGAWVPFLEKAWAKVNGNYEKIISGNEGEGFMFLSGTPSTNYNFVTSFASNIDSIWNIIRDADLKNYAMTISTDSVANACGTVTGHAYTLIGTQILYNTDGTVAAQIYKIRNPWGVDDKYNCSWSDLDPVWKANPTWATQVGWVNNTYDGVFYISKADVIRGFVNFVINY